MSIESNEELGYVSLPHPFGSRQVSTNPDVEDLRTLNRIMELMDLQINSYLTIDALTNGDTTFSVEQQLAINQKVVGHLREVRLLVQTAIEEVKET